MRPALQEILSNRLQVLKRKLYDENIRVMGEQVSALVITSTQDPDFPDDTTMEITNYGNITVIIDFPGDILQLSDNTNSDYGTSQDNLYLYEVLPIKMYSKFTDNIKEGDIIVYKMYNTEMVATPIIFKVTRKNSVFSRYKTWEENVIAMHSLELTSEVQQLINDYMTDTSY